MASKIKALLGLVGDEAPKAGHWMTTLRESSQLPATQPTANESVIGEMLNRPVDRRTFMEGTKNAATALSMGNKLDALADLVPETVPTAAPMEFLNSLMKGIDTRPGSEEFIESFDLYPSQVLRDAIDEFPELKKLPLASPDDLLEAVKGFSSKEGHDEYLQEIQHLVDSLKQGAEYRGPRDIEEWP